MTEPDEPDTGGVLSSLPDSRPQRRSPKRGAAPATKTPGAAAKTPSAAAKAPATRTRASAAKPPAAKTKARTPAAKARTPAAKARTPAAKARPTAAKARAASTRAAAAVPGPSPARAPGPDRRETTVAAQGFEPDTAHGAVEPPTRTDLLGSVAQGAGELAHAGLAFGRELLRTVLGRLPGP